MTKEVQKNLEILSFKHGIEPAWLYEYPPIAFLTTLKNTGNQHIAPTGSIFISRDPSFENVDFSIDFTSKAAGQVLAGAGKAFSNEWDQALFSFKDGSLGVHTDQPLAFGHYYAQLNLVWDDVVAKSFATATTDFWVIPWKLILVFLAIVLLIIFFVRKRFKDAKDKR